MFEDEYKCVPLTIGGGRLIGHDRKAWESTNGLYVCACVFVTACIYKHNVSLTFHLSLFTTLNLYAENHFLFIVFPKKEFMLGS